MSTTTKRPLCDKCRHATPGFREDADGNIIGRCPCRFDVSPELAKSAGMDAATEANPDAMRAALAIIRDAAKANPMLSANTVRSRMVIAQVPGPVIGAAWRQACVDRIVRPAGTEPSTQPETHSHHVRIYESLIYRAGAA